MNRVQVIENIVAARRARTYLEIGVQKGFCFLKIKARSKAAVDPWLMIGRKAKIRSWFSNACNLFNKYYVMRSDDFFQLRPAWLVRRGIDVAFVDGLHTQAQAHADVLNALKHLNEEGVIVVHDCLPPTAAAAFPARSEQEAAQANPPGWHGEWCGDVWKTIVQLRSSADDLNVFVLDCDYGVGIITRGRPGHQLDLTPTQIAALTYEDLVRDTAGLLNLKPASYLDEFLAGDPP